jgi:hypothetical protein
LEARALKKCPPVTPAKRSRFAGLAIPEKPALKGSDIHSVEFGNLCLSSLMVQVGCNSPLASIGSGGFFHAADYIMIIRHLNS